MGAVDLVIQVEAPPSVASGLQRVGRAGHQVGAVSTGVVLPKYRSDLLTSAVVVQRMRSGAIEELRIPANPLDVAAQQIVACVAMDDWPAADLLALLRRTAPFADLTPAVYEAVVEMLAGRYPSDAFAELRPRHRLGPRRRPADGPARRPAAGRHLRGDDPRSRAVRRAHRGRRAGRRARRGDGLRVAGRRHLRPGGQQLADHRDHPRPGQRRAGRGSPGRLPFWRGDNLGRPAELGRAIGEFTREMSEHGARAGPRPPGRARPRRLGGCATSWPTWPSSRRPATCPTDRTIVVERTRDELGDWRLTVLSPFGAQVHAPWALLARERLRCGSGSTPPSCTATTASSPGCPTCPTTTGSPMRPPACSPTPTRSRPTSPA